MRAHTWLPLSCLLLLACGSVSPSKTAKDGAADDTGSHRGGSSGGGSGGAAGGGSGGAGEGGSTGQGGTAGHDAGTGGTAGHDAGAGGTAGHDAGAGGTAGSDAGSGGVTGHDAAVDHAADAGDAGDVCRALQDKYTAAFTDARRCNPAANALQCQQTASGSLSCPGCVTHVQDTTMLTAIRAEWTAAGCKSQICPAAGLAIACVAPGTGTCVANDGGGLGGTCVEVFTPLPLSP